MWKIYEYNEQGCTSKKTNVDSTFYCLKMGVGFGSENGSVTTGKTYSKYADMKNPKDDTDKNIINAYKETLQEKKDENYNSLVWLLNNCYVPAKTNASEQEKNSAKEYKKQMLTDAYIDPSSILFMEKYNDITDDLIDIVQQLAIWHFTNANTQYDTEVITGVQICSNKEATQKAKNTANYQDIMDFFENEDGCEDASWELLDELEQLYTNLIDKAESHKDTVPSISATNPVQLNSEKAKIEKKNSEGEEGEYTLIGPFTLKEINKGSSYTIEGKLTAGTETDIQYTLIKGEQAQETTAQNEELTLKKLAESEEQFYLKVNKTNATNIDSAKFKITTKVKQNTLTYWEVNENNNSNEQPVVEIKPEEKEYSQEVVLNFTEFDLALRKFITKINNEEVNTSREPKISEETLKALKEGSIKTVTKEHPKNALEVNLGDTVLYTIRIYNEGDIDGYASQITDYLPTGLTLKDNSEINTKYGWKNGETENGRTIITTDKLKDILIPKFAKTKEESGSTQTDSEQSDIKIKKVEGKDKECTLYYVDLEIECTVSAGMSELSQNLKNIAEITKAEKKKENSESEREEVKDRDSNPKDLTDDQKNNYHPSTSTKGWGYEDDDDYEELVLPGKYFDLALRKFITKVNNKEVDPSRIPEITQETLKKLKEASITTVTKEHTKDPVKVNIGDTILYTIRVYNEGEVDGYASQITDYLPTGLILKPDSDINKQYKWQTKTENGKTVITTDYLKDTLLEKFEKEKEENELTIKYADVQVECIVSVENSEEEQRFKNVAEITKAEAKDSSNNRYEVKDRDSTPNNLTDEQKNNYHPGTSTQGKGYEDDDDYEELILPGKYFDLSLRKFITNINGKELFKEDGETYKREPKIDITPLKDGSSTTASYKHQKDPVGVSVGDIVIYTIRVYNEGQIDGYASEVTDYLPPQLEFVMNDEENFNAVYGWEIDSTLRKATTKYLAKPEIDPEDNLIKAFDGENLDYKELKIKCKVISTNGLDKVITNIAAITAFTDAEGKTIKDRDSQNGVDLPNDSDLPDYKGNDANKSVLTDEGYFYKGQQDDDDFEKLILEDFDLALRKFITKINEESITNRVPKFTKVKDENGNYIYEHTKEPIEVSSTDIVEYTIRVYNEGDIAGYAKEIKDDMPEGLEFLPENETNKEYRWVMIDENGNVTEDVTKAVSIKTDYLSKEQEKQDGENLLQAFDSTMESPNYKDVKVVFKVVALDSYQGIITNIAEISDDSDETGNPIDDKDSTPDNNNEKEDDIDKEHLKLSYFDLALRKFITSVNNTEVTNRVPQFTITPDGKYTYEHTKEPVDVVNGDIVTYTLRIYNEGTKDGYAKEIKDDIPEGLEFLPENETNKEYRWVMIDENGNVTEDVTKAVSIKTDYLSKEQEDLTQRDNLLKKFDQNSMEEPDFRDIKIAFKVTEPNTSDRIIINEAQISDDSDKNGKDVIDKDSTPDRWVEGEDDQDIEKVKVKYFDLALRKWVTEAIVIENGKETVTQTGHKAEDDPEATVKVEIKEKNLNKVVVKFRYKIRITNEGEIAGYATEISDYIPEGLKFVAADNPNWKEENGKIVTDQLKDRLLQPGETAEVEVLLTWINGKDNLGLKTNVAEISKDKNDSNTPDIDSTPNNQKPGEDDIDDAPVILSVKTGVENGVEYITLIAGSLGILSAGTILIKKYVL